MNIVLKCRGMTWDENCNFDDFRDEFVKNNQDAPNKRILGEMARWIIKNVYKEDINKFTAAEVYRIYQTTLVKTNEVREDEIKNLLPLANGSATEEATAQTAEESEKA